MIDVELDRLARQLRNYLDAIPTETPPQVTTLVHRYLCMHISSALDQSIQLMFGEYARRHSHPNIVRYITKRMGRGRNYNTQAIIEVLSLMVSDWGHSFSEEAVRTGLKEKLDGLCDIRNSLAHGTEAQISRPTLDGYFHAYKEAVRLIKSLMLP